MIVRWLRLVWLMGCVGAPAYAQQAQDADPSLQMYLAVRKTQFSDDKCHVLQAKERAAIDKYLIGLTAYIKSGPSSALLKQLDVLAPALAERTDCGAAAQPAHEVYVEVQIRDLSMARLPYAFALDMGGRCSVISDKEKDVLTRAWAQFGAAILTDYGKEISDKVSAFDSEQRKRSEQIPCTDARQTIDVMMKAAAQMGVQ